MNCEWFDARTVLHRRALIVLSMENLLKGIPRVTVYIDDFLIASDSESEHLKTLEAV